MSPPSGSRPAPENVARAAFWLVCSSTLIAFLNYGLNVFLGWALPVEAYGQVGVSQTLRFVCAWFLAAGFPWVVSRAIAQARGAAPDDHGPGTQAWRTYKTAWLANAGLTMVVVGCLLLAFERHWVALGPSYRILIGLVAVSTMALGIGAVPAAGLQGLRRFGVLSAITSGEALITVIVAVGLVLLGFGAPGVIAGSAFAAVLVCGFDIWQIRDKPFWRAEGWGGLATVRSAVPMTVAVFGGVLLTNIDLLAIKFLTPAADSDLLSGAYQAAAVLARAPLFVVTALIQVFYPRMAEYANSEHHSRAPRQLLSWFGLAILPLNIIMAVGSTAVVLFFFPPRYLPAAAALAILAVGSGFLACASVVASIHQALGRTRGPALIMGIAVLSQVVGLMRVVPNTGMLGAAMTSAAASVLACVLLVCYSLGYGLVPATAKRQAASLVVLVLAVLPLATFLQRADRPFVAAWVAIAVGMYVATNLLLNVVDTRGLAATTLPAGIGRRIVTRCIDWANALNHAGQYLEYAMLRRARRAYPR